jgi:flagellar motor switch protein FliG
MPLINRHKGCYVIPSFPELPAAGSDTAGLTKREKAAVIVRALLGGGGELSLSTLAIEQQSGLMDQMRQMRPLDRGTVEAVIDEFVAELESTALTFPKDIGGTLDLMGKSLDPSLAGRLRKEAGLAPQSNPWETIAGLPVTQLVDLLAGESIEVSAVVLSKLQVAKAVEILAALPGERAGRITYSISVTTGVTPQAIELIGISTVDQLGTQPVQAFDDSSVERVGAILNFARAQTRDDVLVGLDETDPKFAEDVRKSIFTFANIPERIDPRDVPKITKDVALEQLLTALSAALSTGMEAPPISFWTTCPSGWPKVCATRSKMAGLFLKPTARMP